jgi:hypothetical protein
LSVIYIHNPDDFINNEGSVNSMLSIAPLLSPQDKERLTPMLDDKLGQVLSGQNPINDKTLLYLNLLMEIQKSNNNSIELKKLKLDANKLLDQLVSTVNLNNTEGMVFGDSMYSGQVFKITNNDTFIAELATSNSLPLYNMTECDKLLKSYYNVSDITYATSSLDGTVVHDTGNNLYNINAYDTATSAPLDLNYCNNSLTVQLPLVDISEIDITKFNEMKKQGVDIFNPNDPAFNDRCNAHVDNITGLDTTVNWRKKNYLSHKVPVCVGHNCTYKAISEKNYITCDCQGLSSIGIFNRMENVVTATIAQVNLGIVTCYGLIVRK